MIGSRAMPVAVLALTAGAFGIGTTEFIIMGLLLQVAADMHVSVSTAGLLISGYALGVFVGAPILTLATRRMPRKAVLLALMAIFTLGNAACALAPSYGLLMAARVLTSLAHGTFFRRWIGGGDRVGAGKQTGLGDFHDVCRSHSCDPARRAVRGLVRPPARLACGVLGGGGDRNFSFCRARAVRPRRCRPR